MGCGSCGTQDGITPKGCKSNGSCGSGGCNKLNVFDWLANMEIPNGQAPFDIVEIRFKNSRKGFYKNIDKLPLVTGEVVAVEAASGHDIGIVSLCGELVKLQMKKKNISFDSEEIKKIYRKAKALDIEKWNAAKALEEETMYKARTQAVKLNLNMKISDVEYQGDKTKAIFYYTADERVDFRELIKNLAEEFKVRIEMRQIGSRQEAGRLGGIGSCGRELCCSTWLTDFRSVTTSAARYQQLSIKGFPDTNVKLNTLKGKAFHQKTDIFKKLFWYSYESDPNVFIELSLARVKEIIELNQKEILPAELLKEPAKNVVKEYTPDYENVVGQDSLNRFDHKKKKKKKRNKNKRENPNQQKHKRSDQK
jgi:cell fate regulator YaaT (PSP1 superfamily)